MAAQKYLPPPFSICDINLAAGRALIAKEERSTSWNRHAFCIRIQSAGLLDAPNRGIGMWRPILRFMLAAFALSSFSLLFVFGSAQATTGMDHRSFTRHGVHE